MRNLMKNLMKISYPYGLPYLFPHDFIPIPIAILLCPGVHLDCSRAFRSTEKLFPQSGVRINQGSKTGYHADYYAVRTNFEDFENS